MPYQPSTSPNDELQAGMTPTPTTGHVNPYSVTLDGALQHDSSHWSSLTPHGVLNTAIGASPQSDSPWEQFQRQQGGYQPGQMEEVSDQIEQGDDNAEVD